MSFTIGSLFDGSGGFPLAASMCGGIPLWASEIEPYPIAVTRSRFPHMKHLGSVTDIHGDEVDPVDVITFGSPCQDLSVAGRRAGLKHEDNGDEETTRSGLFMEAVRIVKEMREKTNGIYPTFAVWENVPGAFSSNKGEDFRVVLEELIKIVEPTATMPKVPKGGWPHADCYIGDGWSLAYRVFDAQYWGVPQRRRRIYLVLDLRGERAREILFERESLRGHFETGRTPWKAVAGDVEGSSGTTNSKTECYGIDHVITTGGNCTAQGSCVYEDVSGTLKASGIHAVGYTLQPGDLHHTFGTDSRNYDVYSDMVLDDQDGSVINARTDGKSPTLRAMTGGHLPVIMESSGFCTEHSAKSRSIGYEEEISPTLRAGVTPAVVFRADDGSTGDVAPTRVGDHNNRVTDHTGVADDPIALDRAYFNQGQNAQYDPQIYEDGTCPTLIARGPSAVCYNTYQDKTGTLMGSGYAKLGTQEVMNDMFVANNYIARRLIPTECARLQGFPDAWSHPDHKGNFTDEEYDFWLNVRNTHAEINGKPVKEYTKAQMLTWYNKLHTDSSEYKLWGNGIALPCALYVMQGVELLIRKQF